MSSKIVGLTISQALTRQTTEIKGKKGLRSKLPRHKPNAILIVARQSRRMTQGGVL